VVCGVGAEVGVRSVADGSVGVLAKNEGTAGLLTRRFLESVPFAVPCGYCGGTPRRVGRTLPKVATVAGFVPYALPIVIRLESSVIEQECRRDRRRAATERHMAFGWRCVVVFIEQFLADRLVR
jgi:hypothetical protein